MSDKTYSNAEFGAIIAKNTQWSDANAKWVKVASSLRSALRIICSNWRS